MGRSTSGWWSRVPKNRAPAGWRTTSRRHRSRSPLARACMHTCKRGYPGAVRIPPHPSQEVVMILLVVAAVLAVLWLLGLVAFHVTAFAIHLLLIAAVIAVIAHFALGKRSGRTRV